LLARNDGATPVVLRAVLFDIPVAGAARIDGPATANCPVVAGAVAAPQSLPSTSVDSATAAGLDPAILGILVALASVVGLASLQRSRARRRIP